MRNRRSLIHVCAALFAGLLFTALASWAGGGAASQVKVDPVLDHQMTRAGEAGYIIEFGAQADLSAAYSMSWDARGQYVMDQLMAVADDTQHDVRRYLDSRGVQYQSYWVANVIVVENSSRAVFEGLKGFPEILALKSRRQIQVEPQPPGADGSAPKAVEDNISYVHANQVWATGDTGSGIVVANIDTGVRYTHEALVAQYRGNLGGGSFNHNYNWRDPSSICGTPSTAPCDNNGHGSHTMGTMLGDDATHTNQIGVAPGAKWIACKGCESSSCSDSALLGCAQWVVAPTDLNNTNPDPTKRPHIVNNSWGGGGGDNWYQASVDAWRAAGIYPVFSTGNSGPSCSTVGSPGDYGNVTGVGGWGHRTETIYSSSSKGQSSFADTENPDGYPYLKPQVSAPAVSIRSSINTSDTAYSGSYSGTSMAAPHVSGTVALMWAVAPCLRGDFVNTENILKTTAMPKASDRVCGTEGPGSPPRPNNGTGWGVVDAYAAVQMAAGWCTQAVVVMDSHTFAAESCTPANGVPDPGETVSYSVTLRNIGGVGATNLVATLQATGGVTSPGGPVNYGALASGASATRTFTFVVDPALTCGAVITVTIHLQDGANDLGNVSFTAQTGILQTLATENFDGVTAPALPAGWVATVAQGTVAPWATVTTYADTAPNSVWTADISSVTDSRLDSPPFAIPATGAQLTFRHRYVFEGYSSLWDGGVLEISIAGGAFQDILAAGGSFAQGGYVGTISSSFGNPLAGRAAWGLSQTSFGTVVVNLPAAAYGQSVVFRWRIGTDTSGSGSGWWVDSIQIYGGYECCTGSVGPTYDMNLRDQYNRSELCLNSTTGEYVYNVLTGAHAGDSFTGTAAITPYGTTMFLFATPCSGGVTHCVSGSWNAVRHTAAATLKAYTPARYSQGLSDANYTDSPPCGVK